MKDKTVYWVTAEFVCDVERAGNAGSFGNVV